MRLKLRPNSFSPYKNPLLESVGKVKVLRDRFKILLLTLSEFKQIKLALSLLKSSKNQRFSDGFRPNRSNKLA